VVIITAFPSLMVLARAFGLYHPTQMVLVEFEPFVFAFVARFFNALLDGVFHSVWPLSLVVFCMSW